MDTALVLMTGLGHAGSFFYAGGQNMNIYTSIEQLIGNTPLLRLEKIERAYGAKANIYAKLEYLNATGSIKDRAARQMILDAEEKGILQEGSVIIEPTSGNTGIGLAAVGVQKGYRVIIVMPDTMSLERRKLMQAYGAELVLSDGKKGMAGAIALADELHSKIKDSWVAGQFDNPSNAKAHYLTTGPEIVRDLDGKVDVLVSAIGTGGTITGTGRYLKEHIPSVHVVAVEPDASPVLSGGKPGPHAIQGIGAGFVPSVLDTSVYDEIIKITNEEAYAMGAQIAHQAGVLVGISSGAALQAALRLAVKDEYAGKNIVVVFPDSGDRYLSTTMFGDNENA